MEGEEGAGLCGGALSGEKERVVYKKGSMGDGDFGV